MKKIKKNVKYSQANRIFGNKTETTRRYIKASKNKTEKHDFLLMLKLIRNEDKEEEEKDTKMK